MYNGRNAGRSYSNCNNTPSNANANRGSRRSLTQFVIVYRTACRRWKSTRRETGGQKLTVAASEILRGTEERADMGDACG